MGHCTQEFTANRWNSHMVPARHKSRVRFTPLRRDLEQTHFKTQGTVRKQKILTQRQSLCWPSSTGYTMAPPALRVQIHLLSPCPAATTVMVRPRRSNCGKGRVGGGGGGGALRGWRTNSCRGHVNTLRDWLWKCGCVSEFRIDWWRPPIFIWDVTPCSLAQIYQSFCLRIRRTCWQ